MNFYISIFNKKINFKIFIKLYFLITIIIYFIYPFIVYFFYSNPFVWIQNSYKKKEAIARSIKGSKIIFISGSNTLFGIRTQDFQRLTGIPSLNLGLHAGLDIDYILYRAKRSINPGDTVILPLEYSFYLFDGDREQTGIDYVLTYDKSFLKNLYFMDKLKYLDSIEPVEILLSLDRKKNIPEPDLGIGYNSRTLNSNGDETYNFNKKVINSNLKKKYKPIPIQSKNKDKEYKVTKGLLEIIKFKKWCDKNKVTMVITWPSTILFQRYYNQDYRSYFSFLSEYFKINRIKILGSPYDFFYKKELFYDSNYHLNSEGMTIRTKKVIELLKTKDFIPLISNSNNNFSKVIISRSK